MKKAALVLCFVFLGYNLHGQSNKYGIPLIKNYGSEVIHGSDYTHSIIKDDFGNIFLANEDMGIIRYDGNVWRTIPVRNNQLIRALGKDKHGVIYAGGKYEFGYLEPDKYGKLQYVSLSQRFDISEKESDPVSDSGKVSIRQKINIGEILSLVVRESNVYFVSEQALFDYDIVNDSLKYISLRSLNLKNVLKVFLIGDKVILGDNLSGLFEYKDGKVNLLPGGDFFQKKRCMVILQHSENSALVATFEDGVFLYNYLTGEVDRDFTEPSLQNLFIQSRIYSGTALPSNDYALGTIQGGVFVINQEGDLIKSWDKDNSGLMDNGVLAFYCDSSDNSELWISTIRFISKVYLNLPVTEFSPKSGINGGVDCICEMKGVTYISTDLGVYKSYINDAGQLLYTRVPGIIDQVFPLFHAKVGEEEFVLAGAINGLFQIFPGGRVHKIRDNTSYKTRNDNKFDIYVRTIVQSKINPSIFYLGCYSEGVIILDYNYGSWKIAKTYNNFKGSVLGIVEIDNGDIIFATDYNNNLFRAGINDSIPFSFGPDKGVPVSQINSINKINNEIVLSTNDGLYRLMVDNNSWSQYNEPTGGYSSGKELHNVMQDRDGDIWISFKGNRYYEMLFKDKEGILKTYLGPLAMLPNVKMIDIKSFDDKIWIAKSNSVFVVDKERLYRDIPSISPSLTKIFAGRDSVLMEESFYYEGEGGRMLQIKNKPQKQVPELKFNLNSLSFFWSTPYFIDEEATQYSYKLEGFDSDWSEWEKVFYKDYTNLPYGHYYFRVKAKTALQIETNETVFEFIVLKPWYLTFFMLLLYAIALVFIIITIIKAYTRKLKNENIRLEGIVAERTAVVVKQKEELESSIHYASRIQMALLPSEAILSENIRNYFILFKPRDIVSGDFYWMARKGERLYIVAADCTGHGVPGAFMSLLGMSFLDEIIDKDFAPRADSVLHELRLHVTESLKQVGGDDEAKDGMDMALLVIDFSKKRIEYSGAYNPCFRVRKLTEDEIVRYNDDSGEMPDGSMSDGKHILETIYASKMPIGISSRMDEKFIFQDWALEKGISYYLFSDGYIDQFGGPQGRKFMKKSFKRLILEIQDHPMEKQKELLEKSLIDWIGNSPQIDDILVMGIRTD